MSNAKKCQTCGGSGKIDPKVIYGDKVSRLEKSGELTEPVSNKCPDCQEPEQLRPNIDEAKDILIKARVKDLLRTARSKHNNDCLFCAIKDTYIDSAVTFLTCPPKPEPSEKLIKRIRTEPYGPKWQHTVIIRTEDRDELCNRIEQLTARIKELEAKDGKAIHGT